jgi:hypothetical protein
MQDGRQYDAFHVMSTAGARLSEHYSIVFDSSHVLRPVTCLNESRDVYRWRLYGNGVPLRIRFCAPSGAPISGTLEAELRHSPVQVGGPAWPPPVPASVYADGRPAPARPSMEEIRQQGVRRVEARADDQIALLRARLKKRAEAKAVLGEFELTEDERERFETEIDILFGKDSKEEDDDADDQSVAGPGRTPSSGSTSRQRW